MSRYVQDSCESETKSIFNFSQLFSYVQMNVDVAYDTDIDLDASVIKAVADELWREGSDSTTIL